MLALFGNLSLGEMVVIAIAAVLIFGKRLPDVASQGARHLRRLRRTLDDLRRETGIDRDLDEVRRSFDDAAREARLEDPMRSLPRATTPATPAATPAPPPPETARTEATRTEPAEPELSRPEPADPEVGRESPQDVSGSRDVSG